MVDRFRLVRVIIAAVVGATVLGHAVPSASGATFTPAAPGPYAVPSSPSVEVSGAGAAITDMSVTLDNLSAPSGAALDVELVAPSGKAVVLMSDGCGAVPVNSSTLTFSQAAAGPVPATGGCSTGSYRPTDYNTPGDTTDAWPVANPVPSLDYFINDNPNGVWRLYLLDDQGNTTGTLTNGFSLTINTYPFLTLLPGRGTSGSALNYPLNWGVANQTGTVQSAQVSVTLTHGSVGDLNGVLVSPSGRSVVLFSHPCGSGVAESYATWTFTTAASTPLPTSGSGCGSGTYQAATTSPLSLPAPVPAGPYATSMSAFDGDSPNGEWRLYLTDDRAGGGGYVLGYTVSLVTADVTAPGTLIVKKPHSSHRRHARVVFTSDDPTASFQCRVDKHHWKACASPKKLHRLKVGHHRVKVRAVDPAGNVDASPAKAKWRVRPRPAQ